MNDGYLIYHPPRLDRAFGKINAYFDDPKNGNQDPYVWNENFLHSFCHITQMSPQERQICFWVSRAGSKDNPQILCDLVFVIESKNYWKNANEMTRDNQLVETDEAWNDHYSWFEQHPFKRKRRYTLKALPKRSFQPQRQNQTLINLTPFLENLGWTKAEIWNRGMVPKKTNGFAEDLYLWIDKMAIVKLFGSELKKIRKKNLSLASPTKGRHCGC